MKNNTHRSKAKPSHQTDHGLGSFRSWYAGKSPIFRFALIFGGLMLLYYALEVTPLCDRVFWPVNLKANAWASNLILSGLQQHTTLAGNTIKSDKLTFLVKRGCDATEPIWMLAAGVIAFPAPFRRKLVGILAGTVLLLGINLLRVVGLFFVRRDHPGLYDTLHLTIFPAVFIMLAMLIWYGWVEWTMGGLKSDAKV